jgi:riboflavin-specific deaminase-like protein
VFEDRAEQLRSHIAAHLPVERPYVVVNMAATADGRAAVDGKSGAIGGDADLAWFHQLRASVDAVLVATGTLRTETYGRLVRSPERRAAREAAGLEADPLAVVVTRSGTVPWEAPMFDAPEQRILIYGPAPGREVAAQLEVVALTDEAAILRDLRARGIRSVLCEGGPTLNASLLAKDLVDELFLTIGPLLSGGDAPRIVEGDLPRPLRTRLLWSLAEGNEVLLRYAVSG